MRFNMTIHADNAEEMRDTLLAIAGAIPESTFDRGARGFTITCEPDLNYGRYPLGDPCREPYPDIGSLCGSAIGGATVPPIADDNAAPTGPDKAVRVRRTKAQIEADAKAAAEQAQNATANPDPEPDPEPAPDPAMAPGEAKLKALEILRNCYGLAGGPAALKEIQKEFGVTKLMDTPDSRGEELFRAATALHDALTALAG